MLSFDFNGTKYMLKVNYMPKCCGESGPRALIRTWLRFTFKACPPLFFFFFNSSALSSLIGMQMFPFIAGRGLCHCSEGTQTSRLVRRAGRNPPWRLSSFVGNNDVWDSNSFGTWREHDRQNNMGGKHCLHNWDWWSHLVSLLLLPIKTEMSFLMKDFILWQILYVGHTALSGSFPSKVQILTGSEKPFGVVF